MRRDLDFFRNDPFRGGIRRDLSRFFDDMFEPSMDRDIQQLSVPVEIEDNEKDYCLKFDVPGIKKDDIKVQVLGNSLLVSGERNEEKTVGEKKSTRYTERRYGSFQRMFTLPDDVKADSVEANYENGVLEITLPKSEGARTHQIKIGEKQRSAAEQVGLKDQSQKQQVPLQ